ncbi:MAG: multiheme c-type cytochrome [Pirellulales bacterium]
MTISKSIARTLALLVLSIVVGCSKQPKPLAIFVSGDTQGWITPCGCAANQSGGLARRETLLLASLQSSEVLYLDAGGSAIGANEYQTTRLNYLLNGLKQCGLGAHNIGGPETTFTPDQLREIAKQTSVTWLSSNLSDRDGKTVGTNCAEFARGGLKIAVAGVVDPELIQNDAWQANQPTQAVLSVFKNRKADVRIVLAYLDEAKLQQLAQSLPEVDYVIGGPTSHAINPRKVGSVTVASATNKGKFLAKFELKKLSKGYEQTSASVVEVKSSLGESREQLKNLSNYYQQLKGKDYLSIEAGYVDLSVVAPHEQKIAGSALCAKCHGEDDTVWVHSKHSHAWEPLVTRGANFDPYCQQCHTTGYGQSQGFENVKRSMTLVGVGCENCHGPSQAHVDNPKKKTPYLAKQQCVRCHDHENSPTFELSGYWAKVVHAGKTTTTPSKSSEPSSEGKPQ